MPRSLLVTLTVLHFLTCVIANGAGLLGAGMWLYKPACADSCRQIIANNKLLCGTDPENSVYGDKRIAAVRNVVNTPECYASDSAFLRTLALCIADRCPKDNDAPLSIIQEWWENNLASGTQRGGTVQPNISYQDALRDAQRDVAAVGDGNVPFTTMGQALNVTSLIREEEILPRWNGAKWIEQFEIDNTKNSLSIAVSSVFIPILLSLLRFLPGRPLWYNRISTFLERPVMGRRHRTPVVGNLGIMPTRGQSLYIVYLVITQIFLAIFPLDFVYPNFFCLDKREHYLKTIGDRTGVIAMADFLPLFLFGTRNNILLWITNWNHSTFLLLHRWVGYCTIIQTSLHSLILLARWYPDHANRIKDPFWAWGVAGTIFLVALWPASILPVRQRAYEFFLLFHQVFAALALVATYYHIYVLFKHTWGFEIWVYVAAGIWGLDRLIRLLRMFTTGYRTAIVTVVDPAAEYLSVEIDGVVVTGHAYLYFPTLSWRPWENHPYSILSTFAGGSVQTGSKGASKTEKLVKDDEKTSRPTSTLSSSEPSGSDSAPARPHITILMRGMDGATRELTARVVAAGGRLSLPVILEADYHANPAVRELEHCSSLLCIAGGVGITGVVQIIKTFGGVRTRLAWSLREETLLRVLDHELAALNARSVEIQTSVGSRLPIVDILREELEREDEGDLGVVVCGPHGMSDEIRLAISDLGAFNTTRAVVFVDESFSW